MFERKFVRILGIFAMFERKFVRILGIFAMFEQKFVRILGIFAMFCCLRCYMRWRGKWKQCAPMWVSKDNCSANILWHEFWKITSLILLRVVPTCWILYNIHRKFLLHGNGETYLLGNPSELSFQVITLWILVSEVLLVGKRGCLWIWHSLLSSNVN